MTQNGQPAQATQLAANLAAHLRDDGLPPPGLTMTTTWNNVQKKFACGVLCFKNVDQNFMIERVPCWCLHGVQSQGRHYFITFVTMKQFYTCELFWWCTACLEYLSHNCFRVQPPQSLPRLAWDLQPFLSCAVAQRLSCLATQIGPVLPVPFPQLQAILFRALAAPDLRSGHRLVLVRKHPLGVLLLDMPLKHCDLQHLP